MKTKIINTKPFWDMRTEVWASLMGMEEEKITEVYGKYLSSKELQTLLNIVKEMIYTDLEDQKRIDYLDFKLVEIMATLAVSYPDFEEKYFRGENPVNHADFYNWGYQVAVNFIGCDKHRDFLMAMMSELDTVYLGKLILCQEGMGVETSLSEWDFCDMLETMSPREVSQLMELLEVDRETKHRLEKCVSEKKIETFVNILSSLSPTGYGTAAFTTRLWYELTFLRKGIPDILEDTADERRIASVLHSIIENKHIIPNNVVTDMVHSMDDQPSVLFQDINLDYHFIYRQIINLYAILIFLHDNLQYCSTSVESIRRVRKCISAWEYAEELEKKILEEKIEPFGYVENIEPLEIFKKKFLAELIIPESIGKSKMSDEYFCHVAGKKEMHEPECRKLYKVLIDEKLLEWNEDACFSFIYRMCPDYTPRRTNPSPIIWLGKPRELFSLIWKYYEGTTKIWGKTKKFFCDANGIPPKINGAKNQVTSLTSRMQRVFDSLK